MDANLLNISNIEDFFSSIMSGKFPNLYYSNFPYDLQENWKNMVFVDFEDTIQDLWGCGRGFANVFLYAKSLSTGIENSKELGKMERDLNEIISKSKNEHYHISRYKSGGGYDEGRNLHFRIVTLILQVI